MKKILLNKIFLFYSSFLIALAALISYQGCSELDSDAVLAPEFRTHGAGWSNPASNNFHGIYIRNSNWNLSQCKTCHGNNYDGGTSGSSCLGCHNQPGGPENCGLCHGNSQHPYPPKALNGDTSSFSLGVGAHFRHFNTNNSLALNCNDCHKPVNEFSDPDHIGTNPDGIAEIIFGTRAYDTLGGPIRPDPVWNRNNASCSGTYCHGTFKQGNVNASAIWNNASSVVCGSCHGDPVTGNPTPQENGVFTPPHYSFMTINSCYICHSSVINPQGIIVNKQLHLNGQVNY